MTKDELRAALVIETDRLGPGYVSTANLVELGARCYRMALSLAKAKQHFTELDAGSIEYVEVADLDDLDDLAMELLK